MTNFALAKLPELLARLNGPFFWTRHVPPSRSEWVIDSVAWYEEREMCAAAIRALQAVVAAEKEMCAKVCDEEGARQAALIRGTGTRWRDAVASEATALRLAKAIRARGTP